MISTLIQSILPLFFPLFIYFSLGFLHFAVKRKRKKRKNSFNNSIQRDIVFLFHYGAGSRYELFSRVKARERASESGGCPQNFHARIRYNYLRYNSRLFGQLKDLISLRIFFKLINLTKTLENVFSFHLVSFVQQSSISSTFFQSFFLSFYKKSNILI